jgi:hypothetical protein
MMMQRDDPMRTARRLVKACEPARPTPSRAHW